MAKGGEVVEENALTRMSDSALEGFRGAFKERERSRPKISGARSISTAGGSFKIGEEDLGQFIELCIIDWVFSNTFYEGRYDPKVKRGPACAAIGRDDHDHILPFHGEGFSPIHSACGDCPKNEWGSDPQGGRGKACKNAVRLVVAAVEDVREAQSAGHSAAQVSTYYLNVPVTSVQGLMKVISIIEGKLGEVCAAQTNVTNEALASGGHKLTFMPATTLFPTADDEYVGFLNDLMESNQSMLMAAPRMEEEEEKAPAPNRSSRRPGGRVTGKGAAKKTAAKKGGVRRRSVQPRGKRGPDRN